MPASPAALLESLFEQPITCGFSGGEVTTTGWIFARDPLLFLQLSEGHDLHMPDPDISKYIRYMPDVPEAPTPFDVTFEPEMSLNKEVSKGSWLAPDQLGNSKFVTGTRSANCPVTSSKNRKAKRHRKNGYRNHCSFFAPIIYFAQLPAFRPEFIMR